MTTTPKYINAGTKHALAIACILVGWSTSTLAVTLDLTTGITAEGEINGAIYKVDNTQPSGTGIFGRDAGGVFLRIQVKGDEEGYNTSASGVMDNKAAPWTRDLLFSSLNQITIAGEQYVPFLLDTNEMNTINGRLITLESLQLFSATTGGLDFDTLAGLAGDLRTTLLYDLDGTPDGDSSVMLDYDLSGRGSGAADMGVFIPVSTFDNVGADDYIILYSSFSGADAGFEEWTPGAGDPLEPPPDDPGPPVIIPEPSTGLLGALGLLMILRRRKG